MGHSYSSYYVELLSNRPPSSPLLSHGEIAEDTTVKISWHGIFVPAPIEVTGYHLAAAWGIEIEDQLPYSQTKARFWLQTANPDNSLPDRIVPNSDTAKITGPSGSYQVEIGTGSSHLLDPYPFEGLDYTFDVQLSNPVRVDIPGFYWVGMAHTSYGFYGAGVLRASSLEGAPRGMKDLSLISGGLPSNGTGVGTLVPPEQLTFENTEVVSETYPNINIWLICQQLTPRVPYGR